MSRARTAVFDLDGTLLDSDEALAAAFATLGVLPEKVTRGHVVASECARLGLSLEQYLDAYDEDVSSPFVGVEELLAQLDCWAVCSNKHPRSGRAELERLRWRPDVALFADAFEGPKQLPPVMSALEMTPSQILFVGDTPHDAQCALAVGCRFAWAGWNPRCAPEGHATVLRYPKDVLELLC